MSNSDQVKASAASQGADHRSLQEVQQALNSATALNLRLLMQVQDMDALLRTVGNALAPVLTAHMAGNTEQTKAALDALLAKYLQPAAGPQAAAAGLH